MAREKKPWLPPRWFIRGAWQVHRALYRVLGGRTLRPPRAGRWGMFRLTTLGRRTGRERSVILAYFRDGPDLVTLAMNGWGAPEPAWWLNLRARPEATATLVDGRFRVRARKADGEERERLWTRWRELDKNLDAYAARRPGQTAVVVLEPA
ncbi:nitroreductase family deazaflavin-dependent oxidoreductase [Amycolatopsis acidicola]|uniref:Nitroreductase family deazaflavin-dependent oxidoreductase n=1 Tax=Amycolatopsis acidicola TaxID=2596893 RepID=A0A5N0UQ07_9PSEU|nr:nitroreductase/quinone reductase family protein [Amycolatopsis acidicola]KAA9150928.1 nitroreductase family deazaflavin-dependent oxidoreductase [Amycolatopsis acidicola]